METTQRKNSSNIIKIEYCCQQQVGNDKKEAREQI
jgi:hypothetical protein